MEITRELLISLAGEGTFQRGQDYFEQGLVGPISLGKNRIEAEVRGSYSYETRLLFTRRGLEGSCDCPASEGFDFCKHCVALALSWQQQQQEQARLENGDEADRIEGYLRQMEPSALMSELLSLIVADPTLRQQWALKADLASGKADYRFLKKQITKALPYREVLDYHQAHRYFIRADSILAPVLEQASLLPSEQQLILADYGYLRLNRALDTIDDSAGDRFYIEEQLAELLISSFRSQNWPVDKKALSLMERLVQGYDVYPDIPDSFIEDTQDPVGQMFYQQVETAWAALPPIAEITDNNQRHTADCYSWVLENLAEQKEDTLTLIEIKEKAASESFQFIQLCELHLAQGNSDTAQAWLDKVEPEQQGQPQLHIRELQAQIFEQQGNHQPLLELRWQKFHHTGAFQDYQAVLALSLKMGTSEQVCYAQAEQWLTRQAEEQKKRNWHWEAAGDGLARFYLANKEKDKAIAAANAYPIDNGLRIKIARHCLESHTDQACALYQQAIQSLAKQTGNHIYERILEILIDFRASILPLNDTTLLQRFNNLLATLRDQQKRKRNLIKLLDQHFPKH